jgi:hypothetical protein
MTQKTLWRGILVAVLSVALMRPASADKPRLALRPHLLSPNSGGGFEKVGDEIVIGIVVAAVVVGVLVIVLIVHYKSRQRAITGCVNPGANGLSVTDEKDKQSYTLSGDTAGVKAGDRMMLKGKVKHTGKTLVFESPKMIRDFGACQPAS